MKRYRFEEKNIVKHNGYQIYVYGKEGATPHFHFIRGSYPNPEWNSCIKIEKAEYFLHGNCDHVLIRKEKTILMELLKMKNKDPEVNGSNWDKIIDEWNATAEMKNYKKLPYNLKMHNYMYLS